MKITLEVPIDDAAFILSGASKGWLQTWSALTHTPTTREQDAFVRLMDSVVLELEKQRFFDVLTRDEVLERSL
jgi:hypothetical protein